MLAVAALAPISLEVDATGAAPFVAGPDTVVAVAGITRGAAAPVSLGCEGPGIEDAFCALAQPEANNATSRTEGRMFIEIAPKGCKPEKWLAES